MNLYLKEGERDQLPGDQLLRAVFRSDLVPVPRTLEFTIRVKDGIEKMLVEGGHVWGGYEGLDYRIIKTERHKPSGMVQGKDEYGALSVTALMDACAEVAFRREKAVIANSQQSIGSLYRSCGAKAAIANDIPVSRFSCLRGGIPSFDLARAMQEECACLVYRDGRLSIMRLPDLFKQEPKDEMGQVENADGAESEFKQRHEIPAFYSIDENGQFVYGSTDKTRAMTYLPRTGERALRNMSRVLVVQRVVNSSLAQPIQAGDLLRVAGKDYAVVTAAHGFIQREGITETVSRFWLGVLTE